MSNYKDRALTLEALRILDAIDKRGSFAAAAAELSRVPSAISYSMQKLEEDLDIMIFDRSGHKTRLTKAGHVLLERGRQLLIAADKLVLDAKEIDQGWESKITIVCEGLLNPGLFFPLINKLYEKSNTDIAVFTEMLNGAWERLIEGKADILIAPEAVTQEFAEINKQKLGTIDLVYVTAPEHPIHLEEHPLQPETRVKYRSITVADTARSSRTMSVNVLDKQPTLTVSTVHDKRLALIAGLGIASMPYYYVEEDIRSGALKPIGELEAMFSLDMMFAWRRDSMGEAKSWLLRELPKYFKTLPLVRVED